MNVAGASVGSGAFADLTTEDWQSALDASFYTAVYAAREAVPRMLRTGSGRIVNTASV